MLVKRCRDIGYAGTTVTPGCAHGLVLSGLAVRLGVWINKSLYGEQLLLTTESMHN